MSAAIRPTVRVTVSCEHCQSTNDLTMTDVYDDQSVTCSRCGTYLGKVGQLVSAADQTEAAFGLGRRSVASDSTAPNDQ